ncbi:hypothetical protein CEXT_615961 [Caerostris extrusa]|uniref:Uncharacterized protein n=1 Tax=Caerostris extrusa TaxID=172846 RepID=A0AAV4SIR7_CAEEX|nr:hypothetical protein CEXT_615961 [Caerostris extrusa]
MHAFHTFRINASSIFDDLPDPWWFPATSISISTANGSRYAQKNPDATEATFIFISTTNGSYYAQTNPDDIEGNCEEFIKLN